MSEPGNKGRIYARIAGTGSYLPDKVLTNEDLAKLVDTSDEWIVERTGILERRIAGPNEFTSHMAAEAELHRAHQRAGACWAIPLGRWPWPHMHLLPCEHCNHRFCKTVEDGALWHVSIFE